MDQQTQDPNEVNLGHYGITPREQETLLRGRNTLPKIPNVGTSLWRGLWKEKWRRVLLLWTVLTWLVFFAHIGAAYLLPDGPYGLGILAKRDECTSLRIMRTRWSLFLNTLATIVFAASNYGLQCLASPTRADLNAAHARGQSMEIGQPSVKNLLRIGWARKLIWLLLAASSIPLHALYNGLLIVVRPVRQAYEVVVSDQIFSDNTGLDIFSLTMNDDLFLSKPGPPPLAHPTAEYYGVPQLQNSLLELKANRDSAQWNKTDFWDCYIKYTGSPAAQTPNIIFVVNWTDPTSNNAVLGIGDLGQGGKEMLALCPVAFYNSTPGGLEVLNASTAAFPGFFTFSKIAVNPETNWTCTTDMETGFVGCQVCPSAYKPIPAYQPKSVPQISYCFNEVVGPTICRFAYSALLLKIITACLAIKAVGLTLGLLALRKHPILVLGDAMTEYLQTPDETTLSSSFKEVLGNTHCSLKLQQGALVADTLNWEEMFNFRDHFPETASALLGLGTAIASVAVSHKLSNNQFVLDLSSPTNPSNIKWILAPTLLANSSQILAAVRAFFDTAYLTKAKTNHEFNEFATKRKGLRVTRPIEGAQRSNYLLQLPFHVVLAAQVYSTLYAWLLGAAVFGEIVTLTFLGDYQVDLLPNYDIHSVHSSIGEEAMAAAIWIIPLLVFGYLIIFTQFRFRRWNILERASREDYMPYPAVSSLVVSAACHPLVEEGDISQDRIKWGVVRRASVGATVPGHCSFSKNQVGHVEKGKLYTGIVSSGSDSFSLA